MSKTSDTSTSVTLRGKIIAAWVATSSELLAYAGLQIAFAFFLGILQDYAPATDLTVLRDRVVRILLGNIVMTLVFTALWRHLWLRRLRRGCIWLRWVRFALLRFALRR